MGEEDQGLHRVCGAALLFGRAPLSLFREIPSSVRTRHSQLRLACAEMTLRTNGRTPARCVRISSLPPLSSLLQDRTVRERIRGSQRSAATHTRRDPGGTPRSQGMGRSYACVHGGHMPCITRLRRPIVGSAFVRRGVLARASDALPSSSNSSAPFVPTEQGEAGARQGEARGRHRRLYA